MSNDVKHSLVLDLQCIYFFYSMSYQIMYKVLCLLNLQVKPSIIQHKSDSQTHGSQLEMKYDIKTNRIKESTAKYSKKNIKKKIGNINQLRQKRKQNEVVVSLCYLV